jgi:peptide/nickel transport system permease protein
LIAKKAARYVLAAFLILSFNFVIPRTMPGDPLANLLGEDVALSPEQIAEIRSELGLDLPLYRQYLRYWSRLLRLDLGYSYQYGQKVLDLLVTRFRWTFLLVAPAIVLGAVAGALLGALAGWRPQRPASRLGTAGALTLYSTPPYFLALIILYLLSFKLGVFPLKGYYSSGSFFDVAHHLVLPVTVLTLFTATRNFMVMRGSVIQESARHYVTFARAKGLLDGEVLFAHVFWNASLPLVTLLALDFGFIFSGALFVEIAFSMNGMGTLIYEAVGSRDYPVLQGAFLFITVMVILANFLADLTYALIDPQIRGNR